MEGAAGGSPLSMLLPFVLIFAVFYFIVIMPAKKQQKKKDAMIAGLKKGDRVVTGGGIHGTVATVEDQTLLLKVSENTKIRISKNAVAGLINGDGVPSEG
ncbi:MAG TPA: preprotein translocase subunit YajC [Methylomirabilota bacterium]|nr:preprotein translocase subunit YajC [Methylomirabilota bacterium]